MDAILHDYKRSASPCIHIPTRFSVERTAGRSAVPGVAGRGHWVVGSGQWAVNELGNLQNQLEKAVLLRSGGVGRGQVAGGYYDSLGVASAVLDPARG
jgi:hypothetical protein